MLILLAAHASAATWVVGSSGAAQYAAIADAVAAAASGDVVVVEPGTYAGGIDFAGKAIELKGRDGAGSTVLEGGGWALLLADSGEGGVVVDGFTLHNAGGYGVYVDYGATVTLRNLVVEGLGAPGNYGGGLSIGTGFVTVEDSVFTGNQATWGGHVFLGAGTLTASRCRFETGAGGYGGAVYVSAGTATFVDSTLWANGASEQAGAVYVAAGAALTLTDTEVDANYAQTNHGGAVFLAGADTLTVDGGTFTDNLVTTWEEGGWNGGAVASPAGSTIVLRGTTLSGNHGAYGGAVWAQGGSLSLDGVTLADNYATYGGAVFDVGTVVTDVGSAWEGNTSTYNGGAFFSNGGSTWTVSGSTFRKNLSTASSAGAGLAYYGAFAFTDTIFDQNLAYGSAGALHLTSLYQAAVCTRCTFSANEARYGTGGAIYAESYSSLQLVGGTLDGNRAVQAGGAYLYYGSSLAADGAEVVANVARAGPSGGIAVIGGGVPTTVTVTGSRVTDNEADGDGGGLTLDGVTTVSLVGDVLLRNRAGDEAFGGALFLQDVGDTSVVGTLVGLNVARYGGGAYVDRGTAPGTWTNDTFIENLAANGGAACLADTPLQRWTNNTFLGNAATETGGTLCLVDSPVDVRNSLLAWTGEGAAVHVWTSDGGATPTFGYNAFYENVGGDAGGDAGNVSQAPGSIAAEPKLVAYSRDGTVENDVVLPLRDSPLVDAGDPSLLDPDGTVSDIGATGGPGASAEDADHDGHPASVDCDDTDAQVNPDAFETWYDGVNADCRGVSDYDQDGDGADAAEFGGADCDDHDPSVVDGCADDSGTPGRGAYDGGVGGGCGCATRSGGAGAAGWLVGLLALRRRRG